MADFVSSWIRLQLGRCFLFAKKKPGHPKVFRKMVDLELSRFKGSWARIGMDRLNLNLNLESLHARDWIWQHIVEVLFFQIFRWNHPSNDLSESGRSGNHCHSSERLQVRSNVYMMSEFSRECQRFSCFFPFWHRWRCSHKKTCLVFVCVSEATISTGGSFQKEAMTLPTWALDYPPLEAEGLVIQVGIALILLLLSSDMGTIWANIHMYIIYVCPTLGVFEKVLKSEGWALLYFKTKFCDSDSACCLSWSKILDPQNYHSK